MNCKRNVFGFFVLLAVALVSSKSIQKMFCYVTVKISTYAGDLVESVNKSINQFERIVGGHYIPIENAPYQVSLVVLKPKIKKLEICGGSIIHEKFVLSALHCFRYFIVQVEIQVLKLITVLKMLQ